MSNGQAIPDLLETQQAQMRLTSDQGVTSTHQVLASVKLDAGQAYPSPHRTEHVLCPVSGTEMPLLRLLVLHDEPRQRLVLRLPEAFRSRVYAVLRWWFDYLAVSPRRILPSYAAQPQVEFIHPALPHAPSEPLPAQNFLSLGTKILAPPDTSPASLVGAFPASLASAVSASSAASPLAPLSAPPSSPLQAPPSIHAAPTQPPPSQDSLSSASQSASQSGLIKQSSTSTRSLKAIPASHPAAPPLPASLSSATPPPPTPTPSFPSPTKDGKKQTLLPSFEDLLSTTARQEPVKRLDKVAPAPSPSPSPLPVTSPLRHTDKATQFFTPKRASSQEIHSLLPSAEAPKTAAPPSKPTPSASPSTPSGSASRSLEPSSLQPPTILGTLLEETPLPPPPSPSSRPSLPALPAAQKTQALGSPTKGVFASLLTTASKTAEDDEIEESPTLMSPVGSKEGNSKALKLLAAEDVQEVADADIEEVNDAESLPPISNEGREGVTQISTLSPETAKLLGSQGGHFDLQRERDQLSALLDPSLPSDFDKALTRASLRGIPDLSSVDLPDTPTVARPAPQALAEMWASKSPAGAATPNLSIGPGLTAHPEPLSPKVVPFAAEWKRSGRTSWVVLDPPSQKATLAFLAPPTASKLFDKKTHANLIVQLQRMSSYPLVLAILTVADENDHLQQIFSSPLDPEEPAVLMFLDFLMQRFSLQIFLCNESHQILREITAELPFEQNVEYLLHQARLWQETIPSSSRSFLQAIETLQQSDIDQILGKKSHNFHEASFADLASPSAAQLASGIVGYWSEAEQFDYLIATKSFPLKTFRDIQTRVIRACSTYGIVLPTHLLSLAVSLKLASSQDELVRLILSNFTELNLQISHPNDLTSAQIVENWQRLFDLCDQLGIEVDPSIETLAERAFSEYEKSQEQPISVEEIEDAEIFEDYEQMKTEDLLTLLQDPTQRLEAVKALGNRGDTQVIDQVAAVFPTLGKDDVVGFADAFACFGRDAEPLLLSWLHLPRPYQREAAMLALGSLGSEQAIEAIIKRLRSTDEWETAAEALGRMGDLAVSLLSRELKNKNWLIRFRAIKALQKIQTPEARRQIEFLSNDPNEVVKAEVLKSLH